MKLKKNAALLLSALMLLCAALCTAGCSNKAPQAAELTDGATLGKGATAFTLVVVDGEGKSVTATVNTDKATVGEALLELGLVEGEESEYGLYVKVVNGITADYDTDGTYWAFYIDGEYAMTGVDTTNIVPGSTYTLQVEKG